MRKVIIITIVFSLSFAIAKAQTKSTIDSVLNAKWQKATEINTIEAYKDLAQKYPDLGYACEASIEDILEYEKAVKIGTHQAYAQYLWKAYSPLTVNSFAGRKKDEAIRAMWKYEKEDFERMKKATSVAEIFEFVSKYPIGAWMDSLIVLNSNIEKAIQPGLAGWYSVKNKSLLYICNADNKSENLQIEIIKKDNQKIIFKHTLSHGQHILRELPEGEYTICSKSNNSANIKDTVNIKLDQGIYLCVGAQPFEEIANSEQKTNWHRPVNIFLSMNIDKKIYDDLLETVKKKTIIEMDIIREDNIIKMANYLNSSKEDVEHISNYILSLFFMRLPTYSN